MKKKSNVCCQKPYELLKQHIHHSWMFIFCMIVFAAQIPAFFPESDVWTKIVDVLKQVLGARVKAEIVLQERSFIGNAAWTLSTVVTAFLILFYDRQGKQHYGITVRQMIALRNGNWMMPLCMLESVGLIAMMSVDYYRCPSSVYYFRAGSAILLLFVLIGQCLMQTSASRCRKLFVTCETNYVKMLNGLTIKAVKVRAPGSLISDMLKGTEVPVDKLTVVQEVLENVLMKEGNHETTKYMWRILNEVSSWMIDEKVDQRHLYDMVNRLIWKDKTGEIEKSVYLKVNGNVAFFWATAFQALLLRACAGSCHFDGIWDYLRLNLGKEWKTESEILQKDELRALLAITFAHMGLAEGRSESQNYLNEKGKQLLLEDSDCYERIHREKERYTAWMNYLREEWPGMQDINDTIFESIKSKSFCFQNEGRDQMKYRAEQRKDILNRGNPK